ncbi:hypothetical protein [Mycolicibacterium sp. XJ1819]
MSVVLVILYLAGWLATTVVLLRNGFGDDEDGRQQRTVVGLVNALTAFALAAVWPISGWLLPIVRSVMDNHE